jgi:hypothetical protein
MKKELKALFLFCVVFLGYFFLFGLNSLVKAAEIPPPVIIQAQIEKGFPGTVDNSLSIETIKTSDNTLHAFINLAGGTQTCNGSPAIGLTWFTSVDNGSTWACQTEISSGINLYPSAATDSLNNIYLTYSERVSESIVSGNILFRKLSKSGSNWVAGNQQIAVTPSGNDKYAYASITLEGTSRLWITARSYDDVVTYDVKVRFLQR